MTSVLWFRHGLRFHDNPALLEALQGGHTFLPIFIFDGESAGTKIVGYNRMKFLLESLGDLDERLRSVGSRLYCFRGDPEFIFSKLHDQIQLKKICFEQDCEPIWQRRDDAVRAFCVSKNIGCFEFVSHTLWDPKLIIQTNGGTPPLTYEMFLFTVSVVGHPPRPVADPQWSGVTFVELEEKLRKELKMFPALPSPSDFGLNPETNMNALVRWHGGETRALMHLADRLKVEDEAFREGFYLPNHARPNLLAPPTSQSPALRYGCLSVRKFYWSVHDLYEGIHGGEPPTHARITGQLIWREYFYTMSVDNPYYGEMERNPICLTIPWSTNESHLKAWTDGKTGFPFIDAVMRQLKQEGWVHHVGRNAVAEFLTRGILWISWEEGLLHFLRYLIDADWSVCAGNWMWVSSSAFEQLLDCTNCVCPINYGRRLDPWGEYVRRYIPELGNLPNEYLYEPWKAPIEIQEKCNAVIGRDYPERIVDHIAASQQNRHRMDQIGESFVSEKVPHCAPSNEEEARQFMWLPETCLDHIRTSW